MKKITFLLACLCSAFILNATEYVYIMSDYGKPSFTTTDGRFQTLGKKDVGITGPSYNGGDKSLDVRLYAKNTYTVTSLKGVKITRIEYVISRTGKYNLTSFTSNVGMCEVVGAPNYTAIWTGDATEVTFTVGEKAIYGIDGEAGAGQIDFTQLIITADEETAIGNIKTTPFTAYAINGVLSVEGVKDGTTVAVYNMTGSLITSSQLSDGQLSIAPLNRGVYVIKIANKATKIVVR